MVEETPKSIIGRAEEVNVAAATARSFSCAGCPCDNNIWGAPWMTPGSFSGPVGGVGRRDRTGPPAGAEGLPTTVDLP